MKLTIERKNLLHGVSSSANIVPSKSILPALENLLLETNPEDRSVRITGTNMDTWARVTVPAEVDETGSFTVPAKRFLQMVRSFPQSSVEITVTGQRVRVTCGQSSFTLAGIDVDGYPPVEGVGFDDGWSFSASDLKEMVSLTSYAVARDEKKPTLQNVLWELRGNKMMMVATNGHKFARMTVVGDHVKMPEDTNLIVPPDALTTALKIFGDGEQVTASINNNGVGMRAGLADVYTRLVDGNFPNYRLVIPQENDKSFRVNRSEMYAALKRMSLVAPPGTNRVAMSFSEDGVNITVDGNDRGRGKDFVSISGTGMDGFFVEFNAGFLVEILDRMPSDEVMFTMKESQTAVMITPDGEEGVPDYYAVAMPLRPLRPL